jgi:hypothetical protein
MQLVNAWIAKTKLFDCSTDHKFVYKSVSKPSEWTYSAPGFVSPMIMIMGVLIQQYY